MAKPRDWVGSSLPPISGRIGLAQVNYDESNVVMFANPVAFADPAGTEVKEVRELIYRDEELPLLDAHIRACQLLSGLKLNNGVVKELWQYYQYRRRKSDRASFRVILSPEGDSTLGRYIDRIAVKDMEPIGTYSFREGVLIIKLDGAVRKDMEVVGSVKCLGAFLS